MQILRFNTFFQAVVLVNLWMLNFGCFKYKLGFWGNMAYFCPKCGHVAEPFNFKHIKEEFTISEDGIQHTISDDELDQELFLMCKKCKIFGKTNQFREN